ncbi:cell division suppressor protein YneA [Ruminiclostridium cellulolyticum]|uniref:Peptidoglycan-binding LysM n=1 Tax=Ruminiclostridium cellulolyticum (strain ATCC 35319 / DSM 5812 / JCM 6584 / H10) TaxID=394503 RepID=B8I2Q0_RUMCH|nr:LysM peptidoglycan-binding domain-containing protein [Ruminiclostridium cellulolyticum]ACL76043.1 Peptidoglycan-binding LysM [Ruminiclostridium cellulolyticum H10]
MARKKYVLKDKKRFFSFLFFSLFLTFTLVYTVSVAGFTEKKYISVTVEKGDSLWSIASKYGGNTDIRKKIYLIKKINHMDSSDLSENASILVPVNK